MGERAIIIGAGQAGAQAAASLRQAGFPGDIVLIGEEREPPYQRPPLSKAFLQGELAADRLALRPPAFYDQQRIELRLGVRIAAIDRAKREIETADGERLAYDSLLLATGAPPRRLVCPGADLPGIHYLRTLADSRALQPVLRGRRRIAVIGAGYIGLEVAASARKAGAAVTVIEMAERALARVAGAEISDHFAFVHRAHGVTLRFGAAVEGFNGGGGVESAALTTGEVVPCDAVVVGIGAAPATGLAKAAGLAIDNGIATDSQARTSDPAIFAAGDCASHPSLLYGRRIRLESAPNAIEQGKIAGANMAGGNVAYDAVPWFWSDQYDVKLQTAGVSDGADRRVVRGAPRQGRFSVWYLKEERLIAVDAVNDPAAFLASKKLIAAGARPDPKILADSAADLKQLLA
jgi:3-phenylpropionate/trans-cinnamate dioxygenase ferredoxin reductase subunit